MNNGEEYHQRRKQMGIRRILRNSIWHETHTRAESLGQRFIRVPILELKTDYSW